MLDHDARPPLLSNCVGGIIRRDPWDKRVMQLPFKREFIGDTFGVHCQKSMLSGILLNEADARKRARWDSDVPKYEIAFTQVQVRRRAKP